MANIITIPEGAIVNDIDIYIDKQTNLPFVNARQYDSGMRYIRASIWNDGDLYPMVASDTICLTATKPDRNPLFNQAGIDSEGRILYEMTDQTTSAFGVFIAEFRIYNTKEVDGTTVNTLKSTYDFKINVAKSNVQDTEIVSTPEFNALTDAIASVGDLITDVTDAVERVNNALIDTGIAINNANTKANLANEKAILADEKATQANDAAILANEKAGLADTATSNANIATTNANTATTNAINATSNANIATTNAQNAADYANDVATTLDNETLKIFKPAVTTYTDLSIAYPMPENGWTVTVTDEVVSYRYNGTEWINLGVISSVDTATDTTLGIVKGGGNINIGIDGTLNVPSIGDINQLETESKELVGAINEVNAKPSVSTAEDVTYGESNVKIALDDHSSQLAENANQLEILDNKAVKQVNGVTPDTIGNVVINIPNPDLSGLATRTEVEVERQRINQMQTIPEGGTSADAALNDIKVGADGKVYDTPGDAVRSQASKLANELSDLGASFYEGYASKNLVFEKGGIKDNSNELITNDARVRSINYIRVRGEYTDIYIPDGLFAYIFEFDNNYTFTRYSGWHGGLTRLKTKNPYIKLVIKNTNGSTDIVPEDCEGIYVMDYTFYQKVWELQSELETLHDVPLTWQYGTISNGLPGDINSRIRTNYTAVMNGDMIVTKHDSEYLFSFSKYNDKGEYIGASGDWEPLGENITIDFNGGIILILCRSDYANIPEADIPIMGSHVRVAYGYYKRMEMLSEIINNESYLPEAWSNSVVDIQKMQGKNFAFAVQSDTHFLSSIHGRDYITPLATLSNIISFDFMISLGDIIRGYEQDTDTVSREDLAKAIRRYMQNSQCPVFFTFGNHENSAIYTTIHGNNTLDECLLENELYAKIIKPIKNRCEIIQNNKSAYYYKDFDDVRVIILNTRDVETPSITLDDLYIDNHNISQWQADWFVNTALNTDKHVVVMCHVPLVDGLTGSSPVTNREMITNALLAFKNNGGSVIGCMYGHVHAQKSTVKDGINHIVFANGGEFAEIVIVDTVNKTITTKMVGDYGLNIDRYFTY